MIIRSRDLLVISVLTFVTVLAWIGFEAYHTATTSTIPPELATISRPLDPDPPVGVIEKLKVR